ncbi:unnamed protein product [Polarella glacialis]|uniref:Glycosyltransferase 2-like domain-containing protein n=3 Tax=Polarella glacialis TaxID=89957 RepID=A0A813D7L7_POLGL|nr:unnamed protein product [Polarella glacialis]
MCRVVQAAPRYVTTASPCSTAPGAPLRRMSLPPSAVAPSRVSIGGAVVAPASLSLPLRLAPTLAPAAATTTTTAPAAAKVRPIASRPTRATVSPAVSASSPTGASGALTTTRTTRTSFSIPAGAFLAAPTTNISNPVAVSFPGTPVDANASTPSPSAGRAVSPMPATRSAVSVLAGQPTAALSQSMLAASMGAWSTLERDLYKLSGGAYNPSEMAKKRRVPKVGTGTGVNTEVKGRVSIVAPSMASRQHYHENLWRCFDAQTWPDKELVIIETYQDEQSSYLREKAKVDRRIVHIAMKRAPGTDFTVGLKRNMTLHMASGEFVVNFDDDDLYAPSYVKTIVGEMQAKNLIGVTLSAWYNYYTGKGVCTFSDPSGWGEWVDDPVELDNILYGYGFSYSHRRQPSLLYPYPDVGFAEDAPFFLKLKAVFGRERVILRKDPEGLCMHIMHRANTAQVLGTKRVSAEEIAALVVTDLKPFQRMIDEDFFRYSPWRPPVKHPALSIDIPADLFNGDIKDFHDPIVDTLLPDPLDVKPRLRSSTFDDSVEFEEEANPPAIMRANTFRNSDECCDQVQSEPDFHSVIHSL